MSRAVGQHNFRTLSSIYDLGFTIYHSAMNSDPAIRIAMLPRDTNSQGTIFGGVILSYIDMAGAIEAHRHTGMDRFVTVAMRVVVEAERYGGPSESVRVTEAEVIYVAVDQEQRKTKIVVKPLLQNREL